VAEEESAFWMLRGVSAAHGTFAQITICFETEAEQLWAIETWKSLDHRSTKGGQSSGKAVTPESDA